MATTKKKTPPTISDSTKESTLKRIPKTEYIESGNVGLDIGFSNGKGIPRGANIMFFGLPGTGKTTIFCDIIVRIMKRYKEAGIPMRMHYVDSESSRDLLESTGVMEYVYDKEEYAPQQVIYHEYVNSFSYLENLYRRMLTDKDNWNRDVHFVFIDSVTNLLSDSQLTEAVNKADFGDNARIRKKLYGKWLQVIKEYQITQFWSVQMSTKQNVQMFEDPKKPAVSEFDKHEMDIICRLTADKDTKKIDITKTKVHTIEGEKEILKKYLIKVDPGQAAHTKNRHGQNIPINIMLYPGHGIINAYIIRKMLETYKLVNKVDSINYSMSPEFAEYMGQEALEQAGITDINKFKRKPSLNRLCSLNNAKMIQYFKEHDMYKMVAKEEDEEDDGLF